MTREDRILAGLTVQSEFWKTERGQRISKATLKYFGHCKGLPYEQFKKCLVKAYRLGWKDFKRNHTNAMRSAEVRRENMAAIDRLDRIWKGRAAWNAWIVGPGCVYRLLEPENGTMRERILAVRARLKSEGWDLETATSEIRKRMAETVEEDRLKTGFGTRGRS